jgi:flagellar L-ring protein precursor FlgH
VRPHRRPRAALIASLLAASASGQSLFERPAVDTAQRATDQPARPASAAPALQEVSLFAVQAPAPREFQAEGLITIIVSERSKLDRKQTADSSKDYESDEALKKFIDLIDLLELQVTATSAARLPSVGIESSRSFEGEGKYTREDRLTDRLTAKILEVKPNGTLVLEARRQWTTDEEDQVAVLSGICRAEDVTTDNTVQSNQLYDLKLLVENNGDLDRSTKKGLIPRVWETIFNF